jgi:tetratricopeptide (TPR) repeat protein
VILPLILSQQRPDALMEYRNGSHERAVAICRNEIRQNAANLEAHVVISWALIALGRYGEARNYALAARNLSRYDSRIIEILGEVNYYQGRNAEAMQYFQEYINLAPEGTRIEVVYYLLGEVYIREERYRHADIALSTAVYRIRDNAAWWTRLGYAREMAGELTQAIAAYEKALSLDRRLPDAQRGLARTRQTLSR